MTAAALLALSGSVLVAQPQGDQAHGDQAAREKALQREVDKLRDQLVSARAKLLEGVKVNGAALEPKAVMRECVYLTGGKLVESKVADFFILEEIEKQIGAGHKPEEYNVTDEDVMTELAAQRADFDIKNPGVDFWEAVRSQYGLSRDTFIQQRKQAIRFDKVFFPGSPKDWPQITKEAIMANTQGEDGRKFLEQLETATAGPDEHGNAKKLPEFWVNMMRQFVQKGLRNWSDIKYGSHGINPEVVLSVNGREWRTDEAFDYVKQGLFVQDLERAMQEVVVREALRQELVKAKAYVADDEFQKRYDEYRQPYDSTPFTVEVIAVRFKGYPCLEGFRARWRLITSYADLIKNEITDENLQAHADKYAAFFADGNVSIDLIPFQARNARTGAWEPDGMQKAKERCLAIFNALEKGELTFDEALDKKGEFFANDESKGRLGFKPLNQIKQQFRESEFTQLLDGYSVSSYLFYDAEVGKTIGPIPGPDGWYIARVNSRTPARRKIDVKQERERELVREDYINTRFMQWAGEVIARAKVE
ncbi:MAG TPA: peptidylprolyl isomerase [Planctomycetota bacterium]|nr:peptidylprolyl isomerase [Planctomycetota bacterium]